MMTGAGEVTFNTQSREEQVRLKPKAWWTECMVVLFTGGRVQVWGQGQESLVGTLH